VSELKKIDNYDVSVSNREASQYQKLMELAITQNADLDKLEKLMDLQDRYESKQAKKEFSLALAKFQSLCPIIEKTKKGHNYMYASLPSIVNQIKQSLFDCGLSYRFEQKHTDGGVIAVTCILTHASGHSESTMMESLADSTGSKNAIQSIGSASSYLMRYTLISSLGIATADHDDDGAKANDVNIADLLDLYKVVREQFDSITAIKEAIANEDYALAGGYWQDLSREDKKALWRAPTKGGIFTTDELKIMNVTERKYFISAVTCEQLENERENQIK
jgi:hypothetical protein